MAAARSEAQRNEGAAFVRWLYENSETSTWKEFADRARVHWASLSDWQTAKSVPDGYNLLQLIKASVGITERALDGAQLASLYQQLDSTQRLLREMQAAQDEQRRRLGQIEDRE